MSDLEHNNKAEQQDERQPRAVTGAEGHGDALLQEPAQSELPKSLQLLPKVGTDECPYKEGGEWEKAGAKTSEVFFIFQQLRHEPSGTELITREKIEEALAAKGFASGRWAYILHDKDTYQPGERGPTGELKAPHFHIAVERSSRTKISTIARAFGVAPNYVLAKPKGAFPDLVGYLTHENPEQKGLGKHVYDDDEVSSNFGWRTMVDDHEAGKKAPKEEDYFLMVNSGEMTLDQVRDEAPRIYTKKGNLAHFEKLRNDYLMRCEPPASVKNIYLSGVGGTGKDALAKALAHALYPDVELPYFTVGGENVSWEGYDGEPVIIWEDMRVPDMLKVTGSRGVLFQILGPHRQKGEKMIVNVKHSRKSLLNAYNIITGPVSPRAFLDGLSGEYEYQAGNTLVKVAAENKEQAYRRIPLVVMVDDGTYRPMLNKGVYNGTRELLEYADAGAHHQQLGQVLLGLNGIKDPERRDRVKRQIESDTVRPILDLLALMPSGADHRPDDEVEAELLAKYQDAGTSLRLLEEQEQMEQERAVEIAEQERQQLEQQQRENAKVALGHLVNEAHAAGGREPDPYGISDPHRAMYEEHGDDVDVFHGVTEHD